MCRVRREHFRRIVRTWVLQLLLWIGLRLGSRMGLLVRVLGLGEVHFEVVVLLLEECGLLRP